jgi:hypothetical protein
VARLLGQAAGRGQPVRLAETGQGFYCPAELISEEAWPVGVVVPFGRGDRKASLDPLMELVAKDMERVNEAILVRAHSDIELTPGAARGGRVLCHPGRIEAIAKTAQFPPDGYG